jgi:LacI family transcriptional regulator
LTDIAAHCGLSTTTVSRALNHPASAYRIPEATRQRIQAAAQALKYHPSWSARSLSRRQTGLIGVLYSEMPITLNGIYGKMLEAVSETFGQEGYRIALYPLSGDASRYSEVFLGQQFDGCLVLSSVLPGLPELLEHSGMPAVMVNTGTGLPFPAVEFDDESAGRQLTQHLIDQGHRRISYVSRPHDIHVSVSRRARGYEQAMKQAGLESHVVSATPKALPMQLLAAPPDRRPTALAIYSTDGAVQFLHTLWKAGLQVPREIKIGSFNDVDPAADCIPPLTTVAMPAEEMGRDAAVMLLRQMRDVTQEGAPRGTDRIIVKTQLVVRESSLEPAGLRPDEPSARAAIST